MQCILVQIKNEQDVVGTGYLNSIYILTLILLLVLTNSYKKNMNKLKLRLIEISHAVEPGLACISVRVCVCL